MAKHAPRAAHNVERFPFHPATLLALAYLLVGVLGCGVQALAAGENATFALRGSVNASQDELRPDASGSDSLADTKAMHETVNGSSADGGIHNAARHANGSLGSSPSSFLRGDSYVPDDPSLPSFGWQGYFKALGAVFLLLGALAFGFYLLKRFGPRNLGGLGRSNDLAIEGQIPLGPKRSLVMVRFLNKRLLIGVTEQQITLLDKEAAGPDHGTDDTDQDLSFESMLEKARPKG